MHESPHLVNEIALLDTIAGVYSACVQNLFELSYGEDVEVGARAFACGRRCCVLLRRMLTEIEPAARARAIHLQEPPVYAGTVKLVLARQRSDPIAGLKLRQAYCTLALHTSTRRCAAGEMVDEARWRSPLFRLVCRRRSVVHVVQDHKRVSHQRGHHHEAHKHGHVFGIVRRDAALVQCDGDHVSRTMRL
jgi:hypothetical protein